MPWVNPTTRSTGYLWTAANQNEIINDLLYLAQVANVSFTSDVSITATTVGGANQIVSAGAATYEAVPHLIEFFAVRYVAPAQTTSFILRDSTTVLGSAIVNGASSNLTPLIFAQVLTPTAASHTYNVAAWHTTGAGTGTVRASTGGAAGDATTFLPGFIRITRIPT